MSSGVSRVCTGRPKAGQSRFVLSPFHLRKKTASSRIPDNAVLIYLYLRAGATDSARADPRFAFEVRMQENTGRASPTRTFTMNAA